ncbi:ABC transporter permease [Croceivirga thetidis]|uniref:FtsX-like permease family protein n=1 Tax=Croceivirga thetidis TaxID=2721623 RepID=A0ABX1GRW9_9FLAO|nr:FtsX-like permease family protein [Croceivirga thetidis]NKI32354.1 FtsX-like permease family protein [Croceivirga thetidis]
MAWRDAKDSRVRLLLFVASIVLGIAAVVAIQLFSQNLEDNIKQQSKALLGADYLIDSRQLPNERTQEIIDSLGPDAFEVNFVSMIAFPKNGGTKLVRVRGIEGAFPFYGEIDSQPESAAKNYQYNGGALVDATLMLQYDIVPGDSIKVGKVTLPIAGALKAIPGSTAISTSVAPPVIIPYRFIADTELIQFGSRKEYQYFFEDTESDLELLERTIDPQLDVDNADLDTHTATSRNLGRRYDNVGKFLNLVAFIALLLGCIGIASSVNIYIKEKLKSIAVLKCMGASRRQSFLIFLIQIAGIGLLGGVLGTLAAVGLQESFPYILQDFLPFEVELRITPQPLVLGVVLGVLMSVLFALLPLLGTWFVSPLQVLRVDSEATNPSKKPQFVLFTLIVLFLFGFSYWLLKDTVYALAFVIGVLVIFSILGGVSSLIMKAVKRFFPKNADYTLRQPLLNLFRPNNQTLVLIVAIGLGTFLIATLYFTKDILLAKTQLEKSENNPNLVALDIQSQQVDSVQRTFEENNLRVINNIPLVTMRLHSIKGVPVKTLQKDTTRQVSRWILNHEFRTTYRDSLIASEQLLSGDWIPNFEGDGMIPISISENFAGDARAKVGDTLVFNVQGVLMETKVGSIRQVDWTRLQLNFLVVFPSGVLEEAPQFNVLTSYVGNEKISADLQRDLVEQFPNVSIIDLRQVYSIIEEILDKVSWVINFMAFFSILTGIIVLIGSVRTSKYQRIRESVLLRTLGAKNKQILKISALEYLFLGLLGSLTGLLLAMIGSVLLALFLFQEPFTPSVIPFLIFLPALVLLVVAIGLSNIRPVLKSSPLEVLRGAG